MSKRLTQRLLAALALCLYTAPALADWGFNLPVGVTPLSKEIYGLHMLVFGVCCAIAVVVFGAMIYSIVTFRKSKGAQPAHFHHSTKAEIAWTVIPIFILVAMAIPAAKTLVKIEDTRASDLTIKVTAYQWKWRYDYPAAGIGFFSSLAADSVRARQVGSGADVYAVDHYLRNVDKPLVVPVGKKVRLLLTANDVIHAWWVPEIGMKRDAIPGYVNELWFRIDEAGTYRGQCAELCGRDHGFMPIVVIAKPEAEYESWVGEQRKLAGLPPRTESEQALAAAGTQ
jgi:cytochrome c oxidase subunit II